MTMMRAKAFLGMGPPRLEYTPVPAEDRSARAHSACGAGDPAAPPSGRGPGRSGRQDRRCR
ncbi:MAG: hypothetical protein MZV70_32770 [Desulfobacterales bacterium]|nr:hypothetical protein [Desulfobacterales bacterium]